MQIKQGKYFESGEEAQCINFLNQVAAVPLEDHVQYELDHIIPDTLQSGSAVLTRYAANDSEKELVSVSGLKDLFTLSASHFQAAIFTTPIIFSDFF